MANKQNHAACQSAPQVECSKTDAKKERKMRKLLLVFIWLLALIGYCDNAETVKVRGKGIGVTKTEALKDAYRDAIEQAVGLYVDAEQMVKNDELVKDQILTQSNAYIEKYDLVRESSRDDGLVAVVILADVRKRELAKKIRDVIPPRSVALSAVSKNLHAKIVTDFKASDDALAIVKNELKDLQPLKQLMNVALATSQPVVEPVEGDNSLVRLWYPVKIEVDAAKYYKEFAPRWSRILDQIKVAPAKRLDLKNNSRYVKAYKDVVARKYGTVRKNRTGVMTRCEEARKPKWCYAGVLEEWGLALNEEYRGMAFLDTRILGKEYVLHGFGVNGYVEGWSDGFEGKRFVERVFAEGSHSLSLQERIDGECKFCIGLVTAARGQALSGNYYKIPQNCVNEILKWQHQTVCGTTEGYQYRETAPEVDFTICFKDESGAEVAGQPVSFRNLETMNIGCVLLEDTEYQDERRIGGTRLWLISPLVGGFAKSYVKWISIDIPKDDVAKIATVSISVEE